MKVRFILGDQLNIRHSWFTKPESDVMYLMIELKQEQAYVIHHIQKIMAFFSAMRNFADSLTKGGHQVKYLKINDPENKGSLEDILAVQLKKHKANIFEYLLPDEYRLDEQLKKFCSTLKIKSSAYDTEHFLSKREDLKKFFSGKKMRLMESFYRDMRKRLNILMESDGPTGGQWNFDHENRKPYDKKVPLPTINIKQKNLSQLKAEIDQAGISYFGNVEEQHFRWGTSREECLEELKEFLTKRLMHFGTYEDAMIEEHTLLFHSKLSFALNCKLVSPSEVVGSTLRYWEKNKEQINIAQVEGFIRQVIGWREYIRGIYWEYMPGYKSLNHLNGTRSLPRWFWDGNTKMNCMKNCLSNSLDNAYAHHIQRLMVIGNFSLLAGLHPDEVDDWYLGVYADAIEWVQLPNTRGMSQYADGGIVGTKPYVASANYISKMSNYCKNCEYNAKERIGEKACPFNSLYWNFYETHRDKFEKNPRIGMVYNLWKKMKADDKLAILDRAHYLLENIEQL